MQRQGLPVYQYTGWIEVLGAGMVHPNVSGERRRRFQGLRWFCLWQLEADRFVILKYGVSDIRDFYTNDVRFLETIPSGGKLMLVSYKWLQDFLKVDTEPKALAEKITRTGIEIASTVHPMAGLKKLVVGKVLTCEKVAGTHLHQCTVEAGQDKPLPIVWLIAPAAAAGEYVIVALHGGRLPATTRLSVARFAAWSPTA